MTSRGLPTVEVEFILDGMSIFASVPSGKSTGGLEARVIIDNEQSYDGLSVKSVVANIIHHKNEILSRKIESSCDFDGFLIALDGTKAKSKLGANFILPLSICYWKLDAFRHRMPLWMLINTKFKSVPKIPIIHFNVLNGGLHSGNNLDCQEIMVCFNRATLEDQLEESYKLFKSLRNLITEKYGSIFTSVGDEGGYVPPINKLAEGLDLIVKSAENAKISEYKIALDIAANSFFCNNEYRCDGTCFTSDELINYYSNLISKYPIYSIEDPFEETDEGAWIKFTEKHGNTINIVADDLTVTNKDLIIELGSKKAFNTVLIKPNQIGSVKEAIDAIKTCKEMGFKTMISHRSAETEDTFISHLAVGSGSEYMKAGAPSRGERIGKYNELIRIEEHLLRK